MPAAPDDLAPIQELLLPAAAVAPGLLAGPEVELLITTRAGGERAYYRLTVLLESSFVRIYPRTDPLGRLLPVNNRSRLRDLVERAQPLESETGWPSQSAAHRMPSM